jgi:hypothetical protein
MANSTDNPRDLASWFRSPFRIAGTLVFIFALAFILLTDHPDCLPTTQSIRPGLPSSPFRC